MPIHIHLATLADIRSALHFLENADGAPDWSELDFRDELNAPHATVLLATDDAGDPVAYLAGRQVVDEAEIVNIRVHPASRRQRIGLALMRAFLERAYAAKAVRLYLEVRRSNAGAITFYERIGMARQYVRRGYYDGGAEDAVVMSGRVDVLLRAAITTANDDSH